VKSPTSITAVAHPNIALVKYWGKADRTRNIPAVPSLSITLGGLRTTTTVLISPDGKDRFFLDGHEENSEKVFFCLQSMRKLSGHNLPLHVRSSNDFPTAAGLASSASGFAALVRAADALMGGKFSSHELAEFARRASGSAPRSLLDGFVCLEPTPEEKFPTLLRQLLDADAWPLEIVIAVTDPGKKHTSSTEGMEESRLRSPYYPAWIAHAEEDFQTACRAVETRDFFLLADVAEHSCLKMHGLMFSTPPGLLYIRGPSIECLHRVRGMRAGGVPVFFTVDAGPQVKAVCLPGAGDEVAEELRKIPGVTRIIRSGLGQGARITGE